MTSAVADLRQEARRLFDVAVARANSTQAMQIHLRNPLPVLENDGRYIIIAIGKAAVPMLHATLGFVPQPRDALAVTNPENLAEVDSARVIAGAHPVPDTSSEAAGREIITLLNDARPHDRVIALISGGGSALVVAPVDGVTLADKAAVNALLLNSGLAINDMNMIRQQLSDLKGGGFLRHAAPAPVTAYILSDVIGDDLRAIASGPTVSPIGTRSAARALMQDAGIWDDAPASVQAHLSQPDAQVSELTQAENILVGSNHFSLDAVSAATASSYSARIVNGQLTGDVADAAEQVLCSAESAAGTGPTVLIFGGETTVQIRGTGKGGRNQELALRIAMGAEGRLPDSWVFLSGGTDGRDGPTDAAGGIVDAGTLGRIAAQGGDVDALLRDNDSYEALSLAGDLLTTGGTGTNVADVQILFIE